MDSTNPERDAPLPESRFSVILVEPQFRDNVGHVARSMLNFGIGDLVLVNAPPVDGETRTRAVHAQGVLNAVRHAPSVAAIRPEFDHLIGFAARVSGLDKAHLRLGENLDLVASRVSNAGGRIGLVFGREDFGLSNVDLEPCDMLCRIPTSPSYRSMNLSHAVTIALYEMTRADHSETPYVSMATGREKDILFAGWYQLCGVLGYPEHRRRQSLQMLRRVIGRSTLTSWEYHRFMGVVSRSLKTRNAWPIQVEGVPHVVDTSFDDEPTDAS